MTNKKNLLERLASGEIRLPSEAEVKKGPDYEAGLEATIRYMEETRAAALLGPRKPGRPSKEGLRRLTEVRSLRLEAAVWQEIEALSERAGCSVNRYIEEAVFDRIGCLTASPKPADPARGSRRGS